jgi:fatty acid desaturase
MKKALVYQGDPWYHGLMVFTGIGIWIAIMAVIPWLIARVIMGLLLVLFLFASWWVAYEAMVTLEREECINRKIFGTKPIDCD